MTAQALPNSAECNPVLVKMPAPTIPHTTTPAADHWLRLRFCRFKPCGCINPKGRPVHPSAEGLRIQAQVFNCHDSGLSNLSGG